MRGIRARPCASVYDAACVHGHEDLGSKRSRGPSGSDPSTPARIRHTRTPMLRGRARRCLGGVPGLYPAGLRLRPPPPPFLPPRSSSHRLSSFSVLSRSPVSPLRLSLPFPLSPCSSGSYPTFSFFSSFSSSSFLPSLLRRGAHTCTSAELIAGRREKIAVM